MTSPRDVSPIATNKQLWLASASPRRVALLGQLGIKPDRVVPADIDEAPLNVSRKTERPRAHAGRLADEKARAIFAREKPAADTLILAADTVVGVGTRILPKTETRAEAEACLRLMSGRSHRVHSGVCVLIAQAGETAQAGGEKPPQIISRIVTTRIIMKRLNEEEISDYLDSNEWQGKAGGYAIQGRAAAFIQQLQGSYTNVVGLPLYETALMLRGVGYTF